MRGTVLEIRLKLHLNRDRVIYSILHPNHGLSLAFGDFLNLLIKIFGYLNPKLERSFLFVNDLILEDGESLNVTLTANCLFVI